jgi:hypothetical protein
MSQKVKGHFSFKNKYCNFFTVIWPCDLFLDSQLNYKYGRRILSHTLQNGNYSHYLQLLGTRDRFKRFLCLFFSIQEGPLIKFNFMKKQDRAK